MTPPDIVNMQVKFGVQHLSTFECIPEQVTLFLILGGHKHFVHLQSGTQRSHFFTENRLIIQIGYYSTSLQALIIFHLIKKLLKNNV